MQFTDAVAVAGTRRRDDGYLVADARIARTGVQMYLGSEVGRPEMDVVRVYRPGSEVFSETTLRSAAHRPVTNDHPPEMVTSSNWRKYAVGQSADEVSGDGIYIRVPLMVSDQAAINDIEAGKRELSAGYTCDIAFEPGVTDAGEAYDAVQKNIRLNHVAIVRRGRAGPEVRIGDGAAPWGVSPIPTPTADRKAPAMELRTVMVDGLSVSTTDQGAQAIDKLTKERDDARKATADAQAAHATALAAKDKDLASKDAQIDDLKGKQLDAAALDKLVAARAGLVATAKAIAKDVKTDGLSDDEIRKAVVVAKVGDAAVKDKSADYINARFDILAEAVDKSGADPVRDALNTPANEGKAPTADKAYGSMVSDMTSAWKGDQQKGAA